MSAASRDGFLHPDINQKCEGDLLYLNFPKELVTIDPVRSLTVTFILVTGGTQMKVRWSGDALQKGSSLLQSLRHAVGMAMTNGNGLAESSISRLRYNENGMKLKSDELLWLQVAPKPPPVLLSSISADNWQARPLSARMEPLPRSIPLLDRMLTSSTVVAAASHTQTHPAATIPSMILPPMERSENGVPSSSKATRPTSRSPTTYPPSRPMYAHMNAPIQVQEQQQQPAVTHEPRSSAASPMTSEKTPFGSPSDLSTATLSSLLKSSQMMITAEPPSRSAILRTPISRRSTIATAQPIPSSSTLTPATAPNASPSLPKSPFTHRATVVAAQPTPSSFTLESNNVPTAPSSQSAKSRPVISSRNSIPTTQSTPSMSNLGSTAAPTASSSSQSLKTNPKTKFSLHPSIPDTRSPLSRRGTKTAVPPIPSPSNLASPPASPGIGSIHGSPLLSRATTVSDPRRCPQLSVSTGQVANGAASSTNLTPLGGETSSLVESDSNSDASATRRHTRRRGRGAHTKTRLPKSNCPATPSLQMQEIDGHHGSNARTVSENGATPSTPSMSVSRTMFLNPYNRGAQTSDSALPPSSHSPLFSESLSTSSSSTAPSTPLTDSNNNNLAGAISSASTKRKREVEVPAAGRGAENQERPSSANDLPISKRTRSTSAAPARTEEDAQTIASLQDRLTEERFQKTQAQKSHTRLHRRHAELRAILASEQDRANHALNILRSDNSQLQRDLMNERAAHAETSSKWEEESQNGLKLQDELDEERKKTVRAEERLAYEKEAREIVMKDAADTHKELQDMKETRAREKEEHDQRLTAVESAKDELTAALQRAEKVLADVGRETEDPFIVPAMLKAFEKISYFSSDAMSPTSTSRRAAVSSGTDTIEHGL